MATYGLPIKEFFIWGDDVEYTRRIALREPSYLVEDSQVLHDTKNNVGSNIVYDDERIDRYRYAYRNEMYIARRMEAKSLSAAEDLVSYCEDSFEIFPEEEKDQTDPVRIQRRQNI